MFVLCILHLTSLALFQYTGMFADTEDTGKDPDEIAESNVEGTHGRGTRRDAEDDIRVCEMGAEVEKKQQVVEVQAEADAEDYVEGSRHGKGLLGEH